MSSFVDWFLSKSYDERVALIAMAPLVFLIWWGVIILVKVSITNWSKL